MPTPAQRRAQVPQPAPPCDWLLTWVTVKQQTTTTFEDWYSYQHLPERTRINGFLNGRRYRSDDEPERERRYFTIYETNGEGVLRSDAYLALRDQPDKLTQQMYEQMTSNVRMECHLVARVGESRSGTACTARLQSASNGVDLQAEMRNVLRSLLDHRSVVGGLLFHESAPGPSTTQRWALVIYPQVDVRPAELLPQVTDMASRLTGSNPITGIFQLATESSAPRIDPGLAEMSKG